MSNLKEYQTRRRNLALKLAPDSLAIIPAAMEVYRTGDTHYRFRQDSDFYYFTGYEEPNALLLITAGTDSKTYLFNLPRDPAQEQWCGERMGQERAVRELGISEAFPLDLVDKKLAEIIQDKKALYYSTGRYPHWENRILGAWESVKKQIRKGIKAPESFIDLDPIIGEMRLIKSVAEIEIMQKAANISVGAHQQAMRMAQNAHFEYEIEAELAYAFTRGGCRSVAYDPIVASGANACILHYTKNDKPLREGELILIDAGGEYANYAADITRTFPKNGKFTAEQKALYELVLSAQKAGIGQVQPGSPWNKTQETITQVLTAGLVELGILKGKVNDLLAAEAYKPFYMHNSGHWLGLDVHDVGFYKMNNQWRSLEEGMVLTVEPGLYIKEDAEVPDRWRGIGIRIEDDILVTASGNKNLTGHLAVEIADIEALIRGG